MLMLAAIAGLLLARAAFDQLARRRHWRIGRWGLLVCTFRRKREPCLRCHTDWRWALPHDIPLRVEHGYCIFPLCEPCWQETSKEERLQACTLLLSKWRFAGRYESDDGKLRWDDDRMAIFAAVEAGL